MKKTIKLLTLFVSILLAIALCACGGDEPCEHQYSSAVTKDATCETEGVKTYTCTLCAESYTEAIAATGHTEVTDAAVAPTCTSTGLTEGSHCGYCFVVLVAQKVIVCNPPEEQLAVFY